MQTPLTQEIYDKIAASRKVRGKPMPSFADWRAEVAVAAHAARIAAQGIGR